MICKSLSPPHHPSAKSGLLSVSSIIVVGLLAMGGALFADYYMDDFLFVLNDTGTGPAEFRLPLFGHSLGSAAADAKEISIFQLLPTFLTMLTGWLFPVNPVASHLWNLGIHLTLSVMIFGLGRRLLGQLGIMASKQGARQAALVAALVFACHPLGTEPVHYAKCHMVQLVAMFGFWASCEAVSFLVAPDKRTGLRLLSASFLCLISYFPGTVLLGLNLCFVALFMAKLRHRLLRGFPESVAGLRGHPWRMLAVLSGLILTGWVISFFLERFAGSLAGGKVIYPYHVVTQGRVFWEYVERLIVPVGLSSDHFQVWSSWRDPGAVCEFAGLVLLMVGSA